MTKRKPGKLKVPKQKKQKKYDEKRMVEWTFPFMQENVTERAGPIMERLLWAHQIARQNDKSQVSWHKLRLGNQSTCQNLGPEKRRFWIWKIAPDAAIMISNHKGISFEVTLGTKATRVEEVAWQYFKDIGLEEGVALR